MSDYHSSGSRPGQNTQCLGQNLVHYRVLMSVCVSVSVCLCVCVCVHDNSKNNGSIHLKLEHIVVYENYLDDLDLGHCPIKVKVTA